MRGGGGSVERVERVERGGGRGGRLGILGVCVDGIQSKIRG